MYQNFLRVIENVNVIVATYENEEMTKADDGQTLQIDPLNGTTAFGSALFGWAFTLTKFSETYAKKFGIEQSKMMLKLWGDNYFDQKAKKWKNHSKGDDDSTLKRAYVSFCMEPVIRLCKATMNDQMDKVTTMCKALGIPMKADEMKMQGKHLMKNVFQKWINAAEALIEMIVLKLPSPVKAQAYRAAYLYEGPIGDVSGQAI